MAAARSTRFLAAAPAAPDPVEPGPEMPGPSALAASAAARGPTPHQWALSAGLGALLIAALAAAWRPTLDVVHTLVVAGFALAAAVKLVLARVGRPPGPDGLAGDAVPPYTVLAPLYREAAVVPQLIAALGALDYPADRLQVVVVLEADDAETLAALRRLALPPFVEVLVNPGPPPRTKPHALNAALPQVRGDYVVVYDAEDRPHPLQLREAAARFAAAADLVCLQAPLRVSNADRSFFARQFALEYAGQFEAGIPGLVRMAAPFPLGGTSNHFRTPALRRLGGWDAFNVTEDADIGFRLAELRGRVGALALPTLEDAPLGFDDWLPQRTRWVKGYMQTWGVHMRRPWRLGWRGFASLQATLGAAIAGAALHGPLTMTLAASALLDALDGIAPLSLAGDLAVLALGWAMAAGATGVGARRAGIRMGLADALASLAYWPLLSIAFVFAVRQLLVAPFHWDKTAHAPSAAAESTPPSDPPLDAPWPCGVSPAA